MATKPATTITITQTAEQIAHAKHMKHIFVGVGGFCLLAGIVGLIVYLVFKSSSSTTSTSVSTSTGSNTPITTPGIPTNIVATAAVQSASVAFSAPTSSGTSTITSYTVTSAPGNVTMSGSSSPIIISGLTAGTSYTFTVTATNASGTGVASAASAAVIPSAPLPLESMYASSIVPNTVGNTNPYTVGAVVQFMIGGQVVGLRMFAQQASPSGGYTMTLRSATAVTYPAGGDTLLATISVVATGKGWVSAMLPTPITINPNLYYLVAYDTGSLPYSGATTYTYASTHISFIGARQANLANADLLSSSGGGSGNNYFADVIYQPVTYA